ncbi:hypothetical protein V7968_16275 [Nocardia vulneris]|uniref:hypothetical protein n=1 Tax=Nocardia vulneris TaxID=1141657 RepID=UPI0030D0E727
MGIVQFGEEGRLLVAGDVWVVQIQPLEERFVEQATDGVGAVAVQLLWVGHQSQGVTQHLNAQAQFSSGVGKARLDPRSLHGDVVQLRLDLPLGHGVVRQSHYQAVFLLIKLLQLSLQGGVPFLNARSLIRQRLV